MDRIFPADGTRYTESFFKYVSRDEQPVSCFVTVLLAACRITESDRWIRFLTFFDLQAKDVGLREVEGRTDVVFLFVRFQINDSCLIFVLELSGYFVHFYLCFCRR